MPRLPEVHNLVLRDVVSQLRYAGVVAARRHVERAERLLGMVEDSVVYPASFVWYQIAGGGAGGMASGEFGGEGGGTGGAGAGSGGGGAGMVNVPGRVLRSELPRVIERLSHRARYTREELEKSGGGGGGCGGGGGGGGSGGSETVWVSVEEAAGALGVGRRELGMLRMEGLSGRRVVSLKSGAGRAEGKGPGRGGVNERGGVNGRTGVNGRAGVKGKEGGQGRGKERGGVVFRLADVRAVAERCGVRSALRKPRVGDEVKGRVVMWAERYRARTDLKDAAIIERLVKRFGVSGSTIRRWLPARVEKTSSASTKRRRARGQRVEGLVVREESGAGGRVVGGRVAGGVQVGGLPSEIAGMDDATLMGHIAAARKTGCGWEWTGGAEVAGGAGGGEGLVAEVAGAMLRSWPDAMVERRRAMGYWACVAMVERMRKRRGVMSAAKVDAMETLLRLALRLKLHLVLGEGMMILRAIEVQCGRGVLSLPRAEGERMWYAAHAAAARGVPRHNPMRGGRLAGPAGLEVTGELVRLAGERGVGTGERGVGKEERDWRGWRDELEVWQGRVDLRSEELARVSEMKEEGKGGLWKRLLSMRYGIERATGPMGLEEIAREVGKPMGTVSRSLRAAEGWVRGNS